MIAGGADVIWARRIRRFAKWAGLMTCMLIAVTWAGSSRYYVAGPVGRNACFYVADAYFLFIRNPGYREFCIGRQSLPSAMRFGPTWISIQRVQGELFLLYVPCWLFLAVVAPVTGMIFLFDRRRFPAGYCRKCAYNFTGNVSGVCSECGRKIEGAGGVA